MSSGDSTSRAWCGDRSIQRTRPSAAGAPKRSASAASCAGPLGQLAEVGRELGHGVQRLACAQSQAWPTASQRLDEVARASARSSQRSLSVPRTSRSGPAAARRSSRAACSQPAGQLLPGRQAARLLQAGGRAGRARSRSPALSTSVVPRNCTPASASWCASSNTATSTLGSSSATPLSRSAMSAKNRWWLTTTRSAAIASRRALHDVAGAELRALAAQAVVARRGDQRDHAAALVQAVELGQVAAARGRATTAPTLASVRTAQRSGSVADWRACFRRCRHR